MKEQFPFHSALVTGASSGLGAALCRELVAQGCTVWGTSRDSARIDIKGVIPISVDLAHAEPITDFVREMQLELGQIDLLINNAGYGVFGNLEDNAPEDIHDQVELMLTAPALLTQAVLPGMKARKDGCIANISSLAARFPLPGMCLYNASKSGLSAFSRCLADELREYGISVMDVQPGDFRSGFMEATHNAGNGDAAWLAMEKHMAKAPDADQIAREIIKAIAKRRKGTISVGSFFQAKLAPFAQYILPGFVTRFFQRIYMSRAGHPSLGAWL